MTLNKEKIKAELLDESNNILAYYDEPDIVERISVMNAANKTTFLGSLRIYDERKVSNIISDIKSKFSKYGKLYLRDERVVPCCSANYTHISFHITVDNP